MSNPSNLYAEKIFSEHPISLWALDDKVDYISLINESQRDIDTTWTVTNGTAFTQSAPQTSPFPNSITNLIKGNTHVAQVETITSVSSNIINFQDMKPEMETFSISTFFNSDSGYVFSIGIGYEYTDPATSNIVQNIKYFPVSIYQVWSQISETFAIPNVNANLRIVLSVKTLTGGVSSDDYKIYFNGITLGQWSEEFSAESLGINPVAFPANIAVDSTYCIEAPTYGNETNSGYYLADENFLYAQNSGIPLVYGASNLTVLRPNNNKPSVIIPGEGFLNRKGKYNEYTVEFWARINCDSTESKKIFGPVASDDGLYVSNNSITLVIGDSFASHFIGEWYRPMLIDIRFIKNGASLLINGEQVLSLSFDSYDLEFPDELDQFGDSQDWLGFYCYDDVSPIEIDCVAIYSYQIPINVAKRRLVYGQGVISPEGINSAYGGISAFIDYPFANYTANYKYPDFAKWDQATFDNLSTTELTLGLPRYSLPDISLGSKSLQDLYDDCLSIQSGPNNFITFRPNNTWQDVNCYINFPKLDILGNRIQSIYGVFSSSNLLSSEVLFKIVNQLTGNYFQVIKDEDSIIYSLMYNGINLLINDQYTISSNTLFSVGINIDTLIDYFGDTASAFFGNQNGMQIYFGGDESGSNQFTGKIYSIGLCTPYNTSSISSQFISTGIAIATNGQEFIDHTASYTVLPTEAYGKFFLDIGASGYWEDYVPLSYFAKFVKDDSGSTYYDLDFIQFNINYPSPSILLSESAPPFYNTSDARIKSYLSLQYIVDGANLLQNNFTQTEPINKSKVINIDDFEDWETTLFEVVDNTIIYPSSSIDFNNFAVVCHINFSSRSTISEPVILNRLEFSSQALNNNSFNPIGTRFGVDLFPYKKANLYYDYKSFNPFTIYKGSTPYLYLTRKSGVEIKGETENMVDRGLSLPINTEKATNYRISASQLWIRHDQDFFPTTPTKIFEINYRDNTINFFMVANSDSRDRARIYAVEGQSDTLYNGVVYYLNGNIVREPVITTKQWNALGLSFAESLEFSAFLGSLNITGQLTYNNIAYYQASALKEIQFSENRKWLKVLTPDGENYYDWQYWDNSFTWEGVLVVAQSEFYGINTGDVYKSYIGTNKIIIDDNEGMTFTDSKLSVYGDIITTTYTKTPV